MKKFLIGLLAGVSAGILFAPESGKKLRDKLRQSNDSFSDFGNALLSAAKDAGTEVRTVLESEDMKKILNSGKKGVEDFLAVLEEKSGEMSKKAQEELHAVVENAIDAAQEAKKKTMKSVANKKTAAKKVAPKAKKTVKKAVSTTKKTAKKTVTSAKKKASGAAKKTTAKK